MRIDLFQNRLSLPYADDKRSVVVDTFIPPHVQFGHLQQQQQQQLPMPVQTIPSTVQTLLDCAKWQIETLENSTTDLILQGEEEDALDDGFVLCDINVIAQKLLAWTHLFPRIKPFFALKCNPDPMVAAVLGQTNQAAGFDCASLSEIQLALSSTANTRNSLIVYANPQRAERDLEEALTLGIRAFTFDGEEELHKIHRAYQKHTNTSSASSTGPPQMILRLLVPDGNSTVPLGEKFGAPPIASRIQALTQKAMSLNLCMIGVSFHCGSGCHDPEAYAQAIRLARQAMDIIDECQQQQQQQQNQRIPKCWLLDIGGGFPGMDGWKGDHGRFTASVELTGMTGSMGHDNNNNNNNTTKESNQQDDDETAAKIASAINPLLDDLFPPEGGVSIMSEPGRYFVEAAFCLCSRIYRIKKEILPEDSGSSRVHYTIAQGVQGVFKDVVLCGEAFHPIPLKLNRDDDDCGDSARTANDNGVLYPSTIHGPSGDNVDIICHADLPELQVGDWLLWDRMGAYTLSISARSGRPPIRYILGGGTAAAAGGDGMQY